MYQPYGGDMRSYRLYRFSETQAASIAKLIPRREGARLVKRGLAEEGVDLDGSTPCWRLLRAAKRAAETVKTVLDVDADASNTAFSQAEVMALAGRHFKHGRSRTMRLSPEQKAQRVERIYREGIRRRDGSIQYGVRVHPEDTVERATRKFEQWNKIGGLLAEVKTVERACL